MLRSGGDDTVLEAVGAVGHARAVADTPAARCRLGVADTPPEQHRLAVAV